MWILARCELPGLAFRRWESNQVRLPRHVPPQDICNSSHWQEQTNTRIYTIARGSRKRTVNNRVYIVHLLFLGVVMTPGLQVQICYILRVLCILGGLDLDVLRVDTLSPVSSAWKQNRAMKSTKKKHWFHAPKCQTCVSKSQSLIFFQVTMFSAFQRAMLGEK